MIAFLDEKLALNGSAQEAIQNKDPRALFSFAVESCVGIREKTGNNDGPMVELIQETIGGHSQEAWCMAFMQTCVAYAEFKTGIMSKLPASEHCLTVWANVPEEMKVQRFPKRGAIAIWQHGNTSNGHTGMFVEKFTGGFVAIEGNTTSGTDPNGAIVREGGGTYRTKRSMKGNGDMKLKGFVKPF